MSLFELAGTFLNAYDAEKQRLKDEKERLLRLTEADLMRRVLDQTFVRRADGKAAKLPFVPGEEKEGTLAWGSVVDPAIAGMETISPEDMDAFKRTFTVVEGAATEFNPKERTITVESIEAMTIDHQVELAHAMVHARRSIQNPKLYDRALWSKDPESWTPAEAWLFFCEELIVNRQLRRVLGPSATCKQRFMIWWKTRKMNGATFLKLLGILNPFRPNKPEPEKKPIGWFRRTLGVLLGGSVLGGAVWMMKSGLAMMIASYWTGIGVTVIAGGLGITALAFMGWSLFAGHVKKATEKSA